jgi:hypothetical protein
LSRALLAAGLATVAVALVACTSSGNSGTSSPPVSSLPPITAPATTPAPVTTAPSTPSTPSTPTPPPVTTAPVTSAPPSSAPVTSSPPSSAPPSSEPPSSTPPSGPPACTNADLDMQGVRGGALPGQEIAGVVFTNSSATKCTLRGYPFAQLRRKGAPLGKPAKHHHGTVRTVMLKPGKSAQVQLTAVSTCQAPESDHVRIRVPGSSTSTDVALQLRGCSLSVDPIEPG